MPISVPSGRGSPFEIFEAGKGQSRADQPSPIPTEQPSDRPSDAFSFSQPPAPFTTSTPIPQSGFGGGAPTPMPRTRDSFGMPLNWVEDHFAHPSVRRPPSTPVRRGRSGAIIHPPVIEQFLNPERPPPTTPDDKRGSFSPIRRERSSAISSDAFSRRGRSGAISTPPVTSPRDSFEMSLNWVEDHFAHPKKPVHPPVIEQFLNPERSGAGRPPPTSFARGSLTPVRRVRSSAISSDAFSERVRSGAISTPPVIEQLVDQFVNPPGSQAGSGSTLPVQRQRSSAITGQSYVVPKALPPDSSTELKESTSIAQQVMNPQYRQYIRDKQKSAQQPMSAFDAYDPWEVKGDHQQYGVAGPGGYQYPEPSPSSLGQSQTGYTEQHPSEEHLPRVDDDRGRRAVYGEHEGRPVQGVADWDSFYTRWEQLGEQYQQNIPMDEPLTYEEKQLALRYGFTFEKELGEGAYGTVWLVVASRLFRDPNDPQRFVDRRLACKVLSLTKFKKPGVDLNVSVKKLLREADLHSTLNHRNIIKCEHVFHIHDPQTGFPYVRLLMFMELCDGDVKGMLAIEKFSEKKAKDLMNDVCQGLQYLHDQNVCHLDIKIDNIMYVKEGGDHYCYKLADFGISKKYVSEDKAKIFGKAGTHMYMAPELRKIKKDWSESKPADIYSLGCVLAEVQTGRVVFKQLFKDLDRFGATEHVSNKWKIGTLCLQLILRMTHKDPKNRPTIAQVLQDPWFANN